MPPPTLRETIPAKKQRSSNLELYRIICMLMIVAHHFVVNSGIASVGGPLHIDPDSGNSIFLKLFGAWGKTGINCFLMITGYFMCTSTITLRKFVKLMAQIYLYKLILFPIFLIAGYEVFSVSRLVQLIMPIWGVTDNFTSCFIVFWLTIPFLNILVQNMSKRQHELLLLLMLGVYSVMGSVPTFHVTYNYVCWFGIIYLIASYIRLYPNPLFEKKTLWGVLTLFFVALSMAFIVVLWKYNAGYYFLTDSNKILAVAIAVSSFMWFKNLKLKYNKTINAFGAGTFGVLLIHANSDAMRQWLWKDSLDVVGHYSLPIASFVFWSIGAVLAIFIICNLIDQLRISTIEKLFFNWYDSKIYLRANALLNKILKKQ